MIGSVGNLGNQVGNQLESRVKGAFKSVQIPARPAKQMEKTVEAETNSSGISNKAFATNLRMMNQGGQTSAPTTATPAEGGGIIDIKV